MASMISLRSFLPSLTASKKNLLVLDVFSQQIVVERACFEPKRDECKAQTAGFFKARYRKFPTRQLAMDFINAEECPVAERDSSFEELFDEDMDLPTTSNNQMMDALNTLCFTSKTLQHQMEQMSSTFGTLCDQIESLQRIVTNSGSSATSSKASSYKRSYTDNAASTSRKSGSSTPGMKKFKSSDSIPDDAAGWTGQPFVDDNALSVYTDGACFQNGKAGATAGIGVYWGPGNKHNVAQRLVGRPTNNRAEIHAAIKAVRQAKEMGADNLTLHTDSEFLINSITKWIKGWKKNGWKLSSGGSVINRDDFEELDSALKGINVKWVHVRGHQGIPGNEAADRLANAGARKPLSS